MSFDFICQRLRVIKRIGNFINVTELNINGNQLIKLPKEIENLINLPEFLSFQ